MSSEWICFDRRMQLVLAADLSCRMSSAMVQSKIAGRTKEQFDSFMGGFDEIIPRALLRVFTPPELEVSWQMRQWPTELG